MGGVRLLWALFLQRPALACSSLHLLELAELSNFSLHSKNTVFPKHHLSNSRFCFTRNIAVNVL